MLGRINRIKGQECVIEALASLDPALRNGSRARIVGSGFEDPTAEETLAALVAQAGLSGSVSVEPFSDDPIPSIAGRTWSRCRRAGRKCSRPGGHRGDGLRRTPLAASRSGGWARWWSIARPDGCCRRAAARARLRQLSPKSSITGEPAGLRRRRAQALRKPVQREENEQRRWRRRGARWCSRAQVAAEGGSRRYRPMDNEFCFGTVIS